MKQPPINRASRNEKTYWKALAITFKISAVKS